MPESLPELREPFSQSILAALLAAGGTLEQLALLNALPDGWDHVDVSLAINELRSFGLVEHKQLEPGAGSGHRYYLIDFPRAQALVRLAEGDEVALPAPGPRSRLSPLAQRLATTA